MIQKIKAQDLRHMNGKEGLILQGCGGSLDEWVDGINEMLTEEGILLDGTKFHDTVTFENESLTCLLFPFTDDVKLDVGKLAMWRLGTHSNFGGTWLSDYVNNRLGGFLPQESKLTYYFTLSGSIESDSYDYSEEPDEVSNTFLLDNAWKISQKMKAEQTDLDMAEFVPDELGNKIISVVWSVDEMCGQLVGKVECGLAEDLTEKETEILKDWIVGQNSDGFGEGLEQRAIHTDEGNLFVSLWQWDGDNDLRSADEMEAYLTGSEDIRMGGI